MPRIRKLPHQDMWLSTLFLCAMLAETTGAAASAAPLLLRSVGGSPLKDGPNALIKVKEVNFAVQDIAGRPGEPIPLIISLPSSSEMSALGAGIGSFILVRNLPPEVSLSAGMPSGRIWIIPLNAIDNLRLLSKPESAGTYEIEFYLIGPANSSLAKRKMILELAPQSAATANITQQADGGSPGSELKTAATAIPVSPEEAIISLSLEDERILLIKGNELLQQGGIAAARLIFEELATQGSSKGAFALARTYDPIYAANSATAALSPNMEEAMKWYKRASELGDPEARRRLAEIGSGG